MKIEIKRMYDAIKAIEIEELKKKLEEPKKTTRKKKETKE